MNKTCWDDVFFNNGFDRDNCVRQYNRWIEHVKATVPPERLLVFNVKEGYGPLCRFLEVAEPDEPFPFENETTSFRKVITFMTVSGALICAGSAALVAAGGYLVYSHESQVRATAAASQEHPPQGHMLMVGVVYLTLWRTALTLTETTAPLESSAKTDPDGDDGSTLESSAKTDPDGDDGSIRIVCKDRP